MIHSTVWREENHVRILWITMLAMCDRNGVVTASLPGLADAAKITVEECKNGLLILESPDPYSSTKDYEGARISEMEGGWLLLNYCKYRDKKDDDDQRMKARKRKREQRRREQSHEVSRPVTNVTQCSTLAPAQLSASARSVINTSAAQSGIPPAAVEQREVKPRKKPTGPHHELIQHWCERWGTRYGKPFPFRAAGGRNAKHIQILLDSLGFDDAARAIDRYLECEDQFLNGHPLGMLLSQLSKFMVDPPPNDGLCAADRKMLAEKHRGL